MAEISRRWKALTDIERASFNNDAQKVTCATTNTIGIVQG